MTGNHTSQIPKGKILCCITGELVKDSSHERNLPMVALRLMREYGYDKTQLARSFPIQMGSTYYYADIVAIHKKTLTSKCMRCLV